MYPNNQFATIHERGHATLSDLDSWVLDPSKYEQERDAFVNDVVRHRIPLFPGESQAASQPRETSTESQVSPADLYLVYLREVRSIPPMERSEEFRYALALEIAKCALEGEIMTPAPTTAEIAAFEEAISSHDPTFRRILVAARSKSHTRATTSDGIAERAARVRDRFDEMLDWKKVLVFRTLPLVPGMARKYKGMGVPLMDLIQEANGSLMKATDRYEWRKGVRFVVYARWWVQQGVLKTLSCQSRTVRTPVYMAQKLKRIRDLNDRAYTGTGGRLTPEQIGKALNEPVERIERALAAAKLTISIDREIDPNGEFQLKEILADKRTYEPEDPPPGPSLSNRIEQLLTSLPGRERLVLELRYGLHDQKAETLEQVSQRLGVSRERVRQIQEQALRRLQSPSKRLKLVDFLPTN